MTLTDVSSLRQSGELELLTWNELGGLDAYVTTRAGGVSAGPYESLNLSLSVGDDPQAVLENRRRTAAAIGADLGDFVFARQVHGAGVRIVGAADRGTGTLAHDQSVPEADVLVTTDPSIVLAIMTADCVPIVLHDPRAGVLACVHAGWRGTVAGACTAAVTAMGQLGAAPERIVAGIGPAIGAGRYQVDRDVHQAVTASFGPRTGQVMRPDGTGRWLLDLPTANRLVLRAAGVADGNIHTTGYVTGDGLFFSDRSARPCGRLALIARLRPDTPTTGGSTP
ncbi:MAG TPA: peptidoglycan editing factor PgeF [Trebonia sp.]|nr:peptidoglycan editing factor PgeF [Trebonia sp.]